MKKDNIILINFLLIMALASATGVIRGRLTLPLASGQIFLPQRLFLGPVLVVLSAFILAFAGNRMSAILLQKSVISACTGFGVMLSGFCGFYTWADVLCVALPAMVFFVLMAAGVIIQYRNRISFNHTICEKVSIVIFWVVVFVSVFYPIGPMYVLIAGAAWMANATLKP